MAVQKSPTKIQRRMCWPSPCTGIFFFSKKFEMTSGINFSGYCNGPKLFEPRIITAGKLWLRIYDLMSKSAAALEAAYGLDGLSGDSSVETPSKTSPYTSSVE